MPSINVIHLAYGVMVVGIVFCYILSRNQKKDMRKAADAFALPFVRLSNYICPEPLTKGLAVKNLGDGRVQVLEPEQQSGAMRAILKRANEEIPVKLFAEMVEAADQVQALSGINRTRKAQFDQPIQEILHMTHLFLTGCENPALIDTEEKKQKFDSFLKDQVQYRMTLLSRISAGAAEEYRELNQVYASEMEALERQEREKRAGKNGRKQ